jgi:alpha-D-xyloside xylohydrolase
MKQSPLLVLAALITFSCTNTKHYDRTATSVTVFPEREGMANVRLMVFDDNIIRVSAIPADTFPTDRSLMLVDGLQPSESWTFSETDSTITISTAALKATVSYSSGRVSFADSTGKEITKETNAGRFFETYNLENTKQYKVRQEFESPADEAFYGLGAHQNGQMNYKNEDVELVQHNIVDVVPFLYSSRNYGILWDNYSITRFGDPREYLPLTPTIDLYDRDGNQGGLTGDYYVGDNIVKTKRDPLIDIEYLETPSYDSFPQDVFRNGKVVWEGSFDGQLTGEYKFLVYASGYFKVWVNDELIFDKWRQNWNPWTNKFTVNHQPGKRDKIKVEWKCDGGYMAMKVLPPWETAHQSNLNLSSEAGDQIDYYFIHGANADEVISGYRHLTGKAPIPPKWAFGFWQSRERYRNQRELVDVIKEYRKRKIPIDNIVLDWQYWRDPNWGTHEFDSTRFPDPEAMVDELHSKLNAHIMISVWPKFNKGTAAYNEMNDKGFLFRRNAEKGRKDWVGIGYESTFYDPFNPEAGKLFWKRIDENLNSIGIDGWWLDATEPDMHSNLSIDERKLNMTPTAIGPGAKYFNAYSLMNSKSIYEGQRQSSPDKRVFILTRSAYAGQQRYGAVTWSGDIVTRWSDFSDQVAAGINFSLSGIPYWTMDIGGFAVERRFENATGEDLREWRELNTRWFQYGTFCPVFRSHGQYPFREIYNLTTEGSIEYNSMVYYTKLRYRLLPYIYSLAGQTYFDNNTIMRGLIMDFTNDPQVKNIADQYMFGPALLINPVASDKIRSRKVYLPSGTSWFDLYTGRATDGGRVIEAAAPLDRMPLFVKGGSIIPTGPDIQHSGEKPDPLIVYVYSGANSTFNMYEDAGVNNDYESNAFSIIPLTYNETSKTLTIGSRFGAFEGMIESRNIFVAFITKDKPAAMDFKTTGLKQITYTGEEIMVKL